MTDKLLAVRDPVRWPPLDRRPRRDALAGRDGARMFPRSRFAQELKLARLTKRR